MTIDQEIDALFALPRGTDEELEAVILAARRIGQRLERGEGDFEACILLDLLLEPCLRLRWRSHEQAQAVAAGRSGG